MASGGVGYRSGGALQRSTRGGHYTYGGHTYQRFAASRYRWPHGYRYRRYAIGGHLPHAFWVHDYYIDDYADYGLEAPPDDYQWIRYGSDLLLVDTDTGEVAQAVYGAFDDSGPPPDDGSDDQAPPDGQN